MQSDTWRAVWKDVQQGFGDIGFGIEHERSETFPAQGANDVWVTATAAAVSVKHSDLPHELRLCRRDPHLRLHLSQRLLRQTVHHAVTDGEHLCLFVGREIVTYDLATGDQLSSTEIVGSRPLVVASHGQMVAYGEYVGRGTKDIGIFVSSDMGQTFVQLFQLAGVRHIHGMKYDEFTDQIWVTSGDSDQESALWLMDNWQSAPERVLSLGQQSRAVELVLTPESVLWGTDDPDGQNTLQVMDRSSAQIEEVAEVLGPVYYGAKLGQFGFFTTAVERNTYQRCAIYAVQIEDMAVTKVAEIPKDRMPIHFQYGTILLSADETSLCLRLRSTIKSGHSLIARMI